MRASPFPRALGRLLVAALVTLVHSGTAAAGIVAVLEAELVSRPAAMSSVAIDGDPAVNGLSPAVFTRNGGAWSWVQQLPPPPVTGNFGTSVAIKGGTIVVGDYFGRGNVCTYAFDGNVWALAQELDVTSLSASASAGWAVATDGDTVFVGAPNDLSWDTGPGVVLAFVRAGGDWTLQQQLQPLDSRPNDHFGYAVAVEGDNAAVCEPDAAYFFARIGGAWSQSAQFAYPGSYAVVLSGDRAIVRDHVLLRDAAGTWSEETTLVGPSLLLDSKSTIAGDIAVVAEGTDSYGALHALHIFARVNGVWIPQSSLNPGQPIRALALSGRSLIVGHYAGVDASIQTLVYRLAAGDGDACTADGDCASGVCQGNVCCSSSVCGVAQGEPCTPGVTACASGFCYDGYCCDRSCVGACEACNPADVGIPGSNGTCVTAPSRWPGKAPTCAPFACNGSDPSCAYDCNDDESCPPAGFCASSVCVPRKGLGEPCFECGGFECPVCLSGWCADHVCCDTACPGNCDACAASNDVATNGICTPLPAGSPGRCEGFVCDGVSHDCPSWCTSEAVCAPGYACSSGVCTPRLPETDCTRDEDCRGAPCVDGVCCDAQCTGGCQVCTQERGATADGTCTTLAPGWPGACSPYLCQGEDTCPTACGSDVHCVDGAHCSDGQCYKAGCQAGTGTATGWLGALVFGLIVLGAARRRP
jgi:hypothetical protein